MRKRLILLIILAFTFFNVNAQEDLMDLLNAERGEETVYTIATFKGARLINGHTVVTRKVKELEFIISHR
ncbi:MAG: hypothetical protein ACJAXX_002651, partial [Roseivirga sp.]